MEDASLRLFCRRVSRTYRVHQILGFPADMIDLRQYVDWRSGTYFFRIAKTVTEYIDDPSLRSFNHDRMRDWSRLLRVRVVGGDLRPVVTRMIETLELERLMIEMALDHTPAPPVRLASK